MNEQEMKVEKHYSETQNRIKQELHWEAEREQWKAQRAQWQRQTHYWIGTVILVGLGLIFN